MRYLFWLSAATLFYTYIGYPALVLVLGRLMRKRVAKAPYVPSISILIAARNEAAHLCATLANKVRLEYPPDKIQIIVVSDASTDGTDAIAGRYRESGVLLLRQEPRRGKTAALNLAFRHATGDVLVFSDANSVYAPGALKALARNFNDPDVGYVTGRMAYQSDAGSTVGLGCRAYMAYEDLLRRSETRLGSIVGVNGGIDAVRRSLYEPMRDDQLPDFVLPLSVVARGSRVVYEPDAVLNEDTLTTAPAEYRMRVRVALRAWWALRDMRRLLNPRRHAFFAVQLFSHKVLRYLAFIAVPVLVLAAFVLRDAGLLYEVASVLSAAFAVMAGAGYVVERAGRSAGPLGVPYYFVLVNAAAAHAFVNFVRGRRQAVWTPRLG
jgi:cellulose synthase/poly-beta-1,6-N-acetylglucosamine synthase-like glycosyltransferase